MTSLVKSHEDLIPTHTNTHQTEEAGSRYHIPPTDLFSMGLISLSLVSKLPGKKSHIPSDNISKTYFIIVYQPFQVQTDRVLACNLN